jgi:hypothetical protein
MNENPEEKRVPSPEEENTYKPKIIITGKKRSEIAEREPPPLPKGVILDDLFLGDDLVSEFGLIPDICESVGKPLITSI